MEGIDMMETSRPPHPNVICIKCKKNVDPDLNSLDVMKIKVVAETNFKFLS